LHQNILQEQQQQKPKREKRKQSATASSRFIKNFQEKVRISKDFLASTLSI
jgi:hypothetical protein